MEKNFNKPFPRLIKNRSSKKIYTLSDKIDFKPSKWQYYFEEKRNIKINESKDTFRVYLSGFKNEKNDNSCVLVLLHGAGYSALTWSLFTKELLKICDCRIIAIDLRGHGSTQTDDDFNLSIDTLVNDIKNILTQIFFKPNKNDNIFLNEVNYTLLEENKKFPTLLLIGHSMGGSLAVHATYKFANLSDSIAGLIVIDVVEATAIDALQSMHFVIKNRQNSFHSIENSIEWCFKRNQTKNLESAKISFPSQIKNRLTNKTGTDELDDENDFNNLTNDTIENKNKTFEYDLDTIKEEPQINDNNLKDEVLTDKSKNLEGKYIWRIDLFKSENYWKSWFDNLSNLFLKAPCNGRLLILADIDRLDKNLIIGQMQGKFEMHVLSQTGHAIQEDVPDKLAELISTFLIRNKLGIKKIDCEKNSVI